MTRFEYILPSETVVKRTFTHDALARDSFALQVGGDTVATVDYQTARRYWLREITLAELLQEQQKRPPEMVK